MGFWAGTYGLKFHIDFLKLFLKIGKMVNFVGIYIFFSNQCLGTKIMLPKAQNRPGRKDIKKHSKI